MNARTRLLSLTTTLAILPALALPSTAHADGTAILGLESDDEASAKTLSDALRAELGKRGHPSTKEMSLVELKLTMGCDDGDLGCIAEGGKTLEVDELIFGTMSPDGDEFSLEVKVLDVGRAKVVNGITTTVSKDDLSDAKIAKTAQDLVTRLIGPPDDSAPTPVPGPAADPTSDPTTDPVPEGPETEQPKDKKDGGMWVGVEKPTPKWKWVGLGVSGGLTLVAGGGALGTFLLLKRKESDLVTAAEDSLTDDNDRNDIPPDSSGDLCALAEAEPADMPGFVTNASMSKICQDGRTLRTTSLALGITSAVAGVATLTFAGLTFFHKGPKPGSESTARRNLRRHRVQMGAAPSRGGFTAAASMRF